MESNEALTELLRDNPRVFWGRVVTAFINAGWNPPNPDKKVVDRITDAIQQIEEYGVGVRPSKIRVEDDEISSRFLQVMALTADGLTEVQIAERLEISIPAVKERKTWAFKKLGARGSAHAIAILFRRGILE